jgi:hypothetical protein
MGAAVSMLLAWHQLADLGSELVFCPQPVPEFGCGANQTAMLHLP